MARVDGSIDVAVDICYASRCGAASTAARHAVLEMTNFGLEPQGLPKRLSIRAMIWVTTVITAMVTTGGERAL